MLKESLLAGRLIYLYGAEGTGKSTLCKILRQNGFGSVFEPSSIAVGADDPFTLPKDPSGIVLMELYGLKKHLDLNEVRGFNRRDIDAWLTISGREEESGGI